MEDARIVDLFWGRDEAALTETESKYSRYCHTIANNILHNDEDAQECVNDVFLAAWNAIPPHKPEKLSTFLAKITRRIALNRWRDLRTDRRGGGNIETSLSELEECIPSGMDVDEALNAEELTSIFKAFLATLPADERRVFVRRYWFFDSIASIAKRYGFSESKTKMMLKRTRDKLAVRLKKEGVWV